MKGNTMDQRFVKRKERIMHMLNDSEPNITMKELLGYLYNWYRAEYALLRRKRAQKTLNKYAKKMYADEQVFRCRKNMNNL